MANKNLTNAKEEKNDEFYTQFSDIQSEINAYLEYNPDVFKGKTILLPCDDPEWSNFTKFFAQNFTRFGLKKLISTSYAIESKNIDWDWQPTLFETENPLFNIDKTKIKGKIFTLTEDVNNNGKIDIKDLKWKYLEGDGDFRSEEVKKLRDEADIIITNPPFSLFREFFTWLLESKKQFLVIGNLNSVIYKEVFPSLKNNTVWLGNNCERNGGAMFYEIPENIANLDQVREIKEDEKGNKRYITRVQGVRWYTNIEHGRRHQPLELMTMADNLKFSKHKDIVEYGYIPYDNFDGIDVPFIDSIPADYDGFMGVPKSFLDKYNPEQFEIIGLSSGDFAKEIGVRKNYRGRTDIAYTKDGKPSCPFARIIIRRK